MAVTRIGQSTIKQGLKKNETFTAGIPPILGKFYHMGTVEVGAGGASSIEFTNIPAIYKHLQIRWMGRTTYAGPDTADIYCQFNDDTTAANYTSHRLYGTGSGTGSNGYTSNFGLAPIGILTGVSSTANVFGVGITDILDYSSSSKTKVSRTICGIDQNSGNTNGRVALCSLLWNSSSPITKIKLYPYAGIYNFTQYSTASLYGVK